MPTRGGRFTIIRPRKHRVFPVARNLREEAALAAVKILHKSVRKRYSLSDVSNPLRGDLFRKSQGVEKKEKNGGARLLAPPGDT